MTFTSKSFEDSYIRLSGQQKISNLQYKIVFASVAIIGCIFIITGLVIYLSSDHIEIENCSYCHYLQRFIPVSDQIPNCRIKLVESIPENLTYPEGSVTLESTYQGWSDLIKNAEKEIDIASFYWTLLGSDVVNDTSDWQGESIFNALLEAGVKRGIKIRIAQSQPSYSMPDIDTQMLSEKGAAEVRSLDFDRLLGAGVLHTKMLLIDGKNFYVGSANMDWRALTQIKEMGAIISDCPELAFDAQKIFEVYWLMGKNDSVVPKKWPDILKTQYNKENPLILTLNDKPSNIYLSSAPPAFNPDGRTSDIDGITDIIEKAEKFVDIAVMDYFPISLYDKTTSFWPVIDDALKKASIERKIHVRLLAGYWNHTRPDMLQFLQSLSSINNKKYKLETKLFTVPTFTEAQAKIPFGRVAHNKYMVTDKHAYIGTSNWSKDYFVNTGGVGLVISNRDKLDEISTVTLLKQVFERDWNSQYSKNITDVL